MSISSDLLLYCYIPYIDIPQQENALRVQTVCD